MSSPIRTRTAQCVVVWSFLWLSLIAAPVAAQVDRPVVDESKEPPVLLSLQIGDETVPITYGKPFKVAGAFQDPSIQVDVKPYREFPYAGLKFHYPTEFTFEADFEEPTVKIWTLSGHTVEFMIMREVTGALETRELVRSTASEIDGKIHKIENRTLKLGKHELKGTRGIIALGDFEMLLEAYKDPRAQGNSPIIMFIDDWEGEQRSVEGRMLLKMLNESFGGP